MSTKKYVWILLAFFGLIFLGNFVLWYSYTGKMFSNSAERHGDLLRLGYILPVPSETKWLHYDQTRTEFPDYLARGSQGTFDVLTIGDSFSNGTGYQNEFVTQYHLSVLHVPNHDYDALTLYYMLDKLGYIDRIQPKVVILESVERSIQDRFGKQLLITPPCEDASFRNMMMKPMYAAEAKSRQGIAPGIMMKMNVRCLTEKARFYRHPYRVSYTTNVVPLTRDVFTPAGREHTLIFYNDDLNYLKTSVNIDMVQENLDAVSKSIQQKGIRFVFLPAPDKFDVYYPNLREEDRAQWPENPFFDEMNIKQKEYIFIDSRKLLREAVASGEKDVYWSDDMHWSWKASKIVCAEIMRQLETTK